MTSTDLMISQFSDQELFQWMDMAEADCLKASETEDYEWHAQCFAALWTLCQEALRRGIKRHYTH